MRARPQAKVRLKRASKIIENLTNLWEGAFFGIGDKDAFIFNDKCIMAAWVQGKKSDKEVRQLVRRHRGRDDKVRYAIKKNGCD
jgi:hypothetical protein